MRIKGSMWEGKNMGSVTKSFWKEFPEGTGASDIWTDRNYTSLSFLDYLVIIVDCHPWWHPWYRSLCTDEKHSSAPNLCVQWRHLGTCKRMSLALGISGAALNQWYINTYMKATAQRLLLVTCSKCLIQLLLTTFKLLNIFKGYNNMWKNLLHLHQSHGRSTDCQPSWHTITTLLAMTSWYRVITLISHQVKIFRAWVLKNSAFL